MSQVLNVYAIYDMKGQFYGSPFTLLNDDLALRLVDQLLRNKSTDYCQYPEDFMVYCIGTYDNSTSVITSVSPRPVISFKTRFDYLVRMATQSCTDSVVPSAEVSENA